MKRRDLVKLLEENGWYLKRNGASHDLYTNGIKSEPIPRKSTRNWRKPSLRSWGCNAPASFLISSISIGLGLQEDAKQEEDKWRRKEHIQ